MLPFKQKIGVFLLLFALTSVILSGVVFWFGSQKTKGMTGFLEVISKPVGLSVSVDDQPIGETPIQRQSLEPGAHEVVLGNSRQKIEIAPTLTSKILLVGSHQGRTAGFSLGYQRLKSVSLDNLQVIVGPVDGELELDGKKIGAAPKSFKLPDGLHKLKVSHQQFVSQEIEFELKKSTSASLQVSLLQIPFSSIKKGDLTFTIEKSEAASPKIVSRQEQGHTLSLGKENLKFVPWQKIEPYWISDSLTITDLGFYFTEVLGFPDLPFCFLISEKGEIFEGLSLWNFDFSQFNTKLKESNLPTTEAGVCAVGLLSGQLVLNEAESAAIKNLKGFLAGSPTISFKLLNQPSLLTLTPGERRELKLEFQNFSSQVWGKEISRLILAPSDSRQTSAFYSPDWQSFEKVGFLQEEMVLPGKIATFILPLQAPFRLGFYEEKFMMVAENNNQRIEDSIFPVKIEVGSGSKPTVKISSTPTGFLNVRAEPSTASKLLGVVYPNEEYLLAEEGTGWVRIKLQDGSLGWVSSQYVLVKKD